jgi:hypothetical protein
VNIYYFPRILFCHTTAIPVAAVYPGGIYGPADSEQYLPRDWILVGTDLHPHAASPICCTSTPLLNWPGFGPLFEVCLVRLLPNERVGQSHQPSTALRSTASRARSALILVGVPVLVPPSRHPVSICDKVLHVKGHASNHGLFSVIQRYSLI